MKQSLLAIFALMLLLTMAFVAGYYRSLDDAWELCMDTEGRSSLHPDCERGMAYLHNTCLARRWRR